jgi:transposase
MSGKTVVLRNAAALTKCDIGAIVTGKSRVAEIARKYNRTCGTILRWLSAKGVKDFRQMRPCGHSIVLLRNAATLTQGDIAAIVSGKSRVSEIARKYNQTYGTIISWLSARGIKDFRAREPGGHSIVLRKKAAALTEGDIAAIVSRKSSVSEIAKKYGVAPGAIKKWLSVRGINDYPRTNGNPKSLQAAMPRWKRIVAMRKKKGITKTAKEFGISLQRVHQICKRYEQFIATKIGEDAQTTKGRLQRT